MIARKEENMGISFNEFHHMGMERYDGGADRWDFDHDGEMSIFEENCRRVHDDMMYDMITEEADSKSRHFGDDLDDDFDDDFGDDFGEDF